jgi:glycine cleavage system H protein
MAFIEKFLGKRVEIPEDLRYSAKQGLWARISDQDIVFGFSEPWLVLNNGINDIEWITSEGKGVHKGDTVVFAITGKISYIDAPTGGIIHFNPEVKQDPSLVAKAPYGKGWLFRIRIDQPPDHTFHKFVSAVDYIESLRGTEGYKNPDGLKGGVSGICKAVYTGIREQKL